jgi:RNA polymerase sigma-70 factor (ECF subfamily)
MEPITKLLWQRSEDALEALAQAFGKRLYATARNILGTHSDAEEAVNDTYLALWNTIPPKNPTPLAPYVFRVGKNIAMTKLRDKNAQKRSGYEISLSELEECIGGPALWEQISAQALGEAIAAFLDTLPEMSRVIFLRRYWFGDDIKDIAAALKVTENTVSVRLHRTRDKLKNHLIKEGFYE